METHDTGAARTSDANHGPGPGEPTGLGRVIENTSDLGGADLDEATREASFPASDPPGFMSSPATPEEPPKAEPPDAREDS